MDSRKKKRFEFFCPLCCSRQRTNTIDRMSWRHHAALSIGTIAFTFLFWNVFGIKALATYLVYWTIFETVYRMRKRAEFICRNCGFDPFLYKSDVEKMRAEVKSKLQERILTEGYFRGKKLRNYQSPPAEGAGAEKAHASPAGAELEPGPDKLVVPMPKNPAERSAADVRDELIGEPVRRKPVDRQPIA